MQKDEQLAYLKLLTKNGFEGLESDKEGWRFINYELQAKPDEFNRKYHECLRVLQNKDEYHENKVYAILTFCSH